MEASASMETDASIDEPDDLQYLLNPSAQGSYGAILTSDTDSHHTRSGGLFSSIFTLVSTMIGGGLLSLSFAFQQGGFAVASGVLIFVLIASTYGGFLIINSKKYCIGKVKNIEDVARVAFGRPGEIIVQALLILVLFLCSVAYFILITDQLEPLILLMVGSQSKWGEKIVVLSLILVVVFPISLLRNLSALKYTSFLSVFCGLLLCVSVMYRSITARIGGPLNAPKNPVKWYPSSVREFFTCVSIAELTFSCHFNILPMHSELQMQTRVNKRLILITSMGLTYLMNFVVSFFGYFQFRQFTDQDITKNYAHDDYVITAGRVALCALLILSYPLLIVPCRLTLNKMIWHGNLTPSKFIRAVSNERLTGPNMFIWFLETVLLVGSSFLLAYLVPQVNMIWGFVGSVGCTVLIYILPPAFYLRVRKHPEKPDVNQIGAILLLGCGVLMLVVGFYQSVMNIVSPIPKILPPKDLFNSTLI